MRDKVITNFKKDHNQRDYGKEILVDDLKNIRLSKPAKPFQVHNPILKSHDDIKSNQRLLGIIKRNRNIDLLKTKIKHKIHLNCIPLINKAKTKIVFNRNDSSNKLTYDHLNNLIKKTKVQKINKSTQICDSKLILTLDHEKEEVFSLKANWIAMKNIDGLTFFLNLSNGMTTYDINYAKEISNLKPNTDAIYNIDNGILEPFSKELALKILYNHQKNSSADNNNFLNYLNYYVSNSSLDFSDTKILLDKFKIDKSKIFNYFLKQ